jgi:hypothetical protein
MLIAAIAAVSTGKIARAEDAADEDRSHRLDAPELARLIDWAIDEQLVSNQAIPASAADDEEFLRRVSLDISGVIPPVDKVVGFLNSQDPDKRARLIDELLASREYGRHMGDIWQDLLMSQRDLLTKALELQPLTDWFAEGFNNNVPWDQQVSELLTGTGTQDENGVITFYLGHRSPDRLTDTVCRAFLGIQLQCAQCHDHPYTAWKRDEYWGMAAFFAKVDDGSPKKLGKGVTPKVVEASAILKKRLPDSALILSPTFLEGVTPELDDEGPYRPALARWLTSAENPYFAKAMVNRLWAQFFGRGLVNPVDSLSDDNPASHPELFEALAEQFVRSGFDVKHLVRAICNSQAYQRSSTPADLSDEEDVPYAVMTIRPLTPEQLFDSLAQVLGPAKTEPREDFVKFFRPAIGADAAEYPAGIPQVLRLMNAEWTAKTTRFAGQMLKSGDSSTRNIETLFLTALSRRPTVVESKRFEEYLSTHQEQVLKTYSDILWALLNSSEFALNH